MKGFEKVHPEAPGAVTCMSCMGRGTHRVTVPRRYGPGTITEHPTCPKCNGSGAVMGDRPKELRRVA